MASAVVTTADCHVAPLVVVESNELPVQDDNSALQQHHKRRRLSIAQLHDSVISGSSADVAEVTGGSDQPYAFMMSGSHSSSSSESSDSAPCEPEGLARKKKPFALSHASHAADDDAAKMGSPFVQADGMELLSASALPDSSSNGEVPRPEQALRLTPKRDYPCRTCGCKLSSASNRVRHERAKHKQQPASTPSASSPAASSSSSTSVQQTSTSVRIANNAPRLSSLRVWKAAEPASAGSEDESDRDDEVDLELEQFASATRSADGLAFSAPALSWSAEEEKSDESPVASSSGSDMSTASDDGDMPSQNAAVVATSYPGMRSLFSDDELQAALFPFLHWLSQPPLTPCEVLVKGRGRLKCQTQLQPIRCNLKFIFSILNLKKVTDTVDLRVLTRIDACQALFDALGERRVGSVRYHALFLIIKKALVYLSSSESTARREYLPVSLYPSYSFVDSVCADSGFRRKQESRDRCLLGIQATQQLLHDHHGRQPPRPFAVPATWSGSSTTPDPPQQQMTKPSVALASSAASGRTSVASSSPASTSPNEMTQAELQLVTNGCLAKIQEFMAAPTPSDATTRSTRDRYFMALIVTITLCLGLAPRLLLFATARSRVDSPHTRLRSFYHVFGILHFLVTDLRF